MKLAKILICCGLLFTGSVQAGMECDTEILAEDSGIYSLDTGVFDLCARWEDGGQNVTEDCIDIDHIDITPLIFTAVTADHGCDIAIRLYDSAGIELIYALGQSYVQGLPGYIFAPIMTVTRDILEAGGYPVDSVPSGIINLKCKIDISFCTTLTPPEIEDLPYDPYNPYIPYPIPVDVVTGDPVFSIEDYPHFPNCGDVVSPLLYPYQVTIRSPMVMIDKAGFSVCPTPTEVSVFVPSLIPTLTPTPTLTPIVTATDGGTPDPTLTEVNTPTITNTVESTPTTTPESTPTITNTVESTPTTTPESTPTITNTVDGTPAPTLAPIETRLPVLVSSTSGYPKQLHSSEAGILPNLLVEHSLFVDEVEANTISVAGVLLTGAGGAASFSDLSGTATDAQVPDDLTIATTKTMTVGSAHVTNHLEVDGRIFTDAITFPEIPAYISMSLYSPADGNLFWSGNQVVTNDMLASYITDEELAIGLSGKSDTDHGHNLQDLAGAVTDAQVPDDITITEADTLDDVVARGANTTGAITVGDIRFYSKTLETGPILGSSNSLPYWGAVKFTLDNEWDTRSKMETKWNDTTIWTADNDGTGSALDADLLDGLDSSAFLQSYTEADTLDDVVARNSTTSRIITIDQDAGRGTFRIEGSGGAELELTDSAGAVYDRKMQLLTGGGVTEFNSMGDGGSPVKSDILVMDHGTGNVTMGYDVTVGSLGFPISYSPLSNRLYQYMASGLLYWNGSVVLTANSTLAANKLTGDIDLERLPEHVSHRTASIAVFDFATSCSMLDHKIGYVVPDDMSEMRLYSVRASVYNAGTGSGTTMDIEIYRRRAGTSLPMLASQLSLADTAYTVSTSNINTSQDDLSAGDLLHVSIISVHSTPALGLSVCFTFEEGN